MEAYIITTKYDFPNNENVKNLTERCVKSCVKYGIKPILYRAITPYNLENVYPNWKINIDYAKRLKINYEKKSGKKINEEVLNRMLVMQQSMTMSHFTLRQKLIEENKTAIILEHDAFFCRNLPEYNFENKVINLCDRDQATHGYVTNPNSSKEYNKIYETIGFVGHDNMNRYISGNLKLTPFSKNPVIKGNLKEESQWDTHRGAFKEKSLNYIPTNTVGDIKQLLKMIQ